MRKITDKLLIVVLCCTICGRSPANITALLTAVTFSSVCQYREKSKISYALEFIYALLCWTDPVFFPALPVIMYDISDDRRTIPAVIVAASLGSGIIAGSIDNMIPVLIFCAAACILQQRTSSYERLYESYIKTVDTSSEVTRLLKENNIRLIENQNYEIRLATLNERNRIAREIHDNVGHLLSRSILQVQAMKLTKDETLLGEGLDSLGDSLGNAMTSIRQSVHNLHDDSVDLDISLKEAVRPLNEKGIDTDYECQYVSVPNSVKMCVVGVVKEAVSNIIRHSCADHAEIFFHEHPAFYQLIISDNGKCPDKTGIGGIGLSNMRARVEELGGIINITSGKNGFRIFISVQKKGKIYENNSG